MDKNGERKLHIVSTNTDPKRPPEEIRRSERHDEFLLKLAQNAFDHLKQNDPAFSERYGPELTPEGNLVYVSGEVGSRPTLLIQDPKVFIELEKQTRRQMGVPEEGPIG